MTKLDTTRRYPRTTLEAFGTDARSACALERPDPRPYGLAWWVCMALLVAATMGLC